MTAPVPPIPHGSNWQQWGTALNRYLRTALTQLGFLESSSSAASDGVLLWDASSAYPVVSKGGEWRQIVLANGYGQFSQNADISAAAADTAYPITFDDPSTASGVSRSGSQISVSEGGLYEVSYGAQIYSTSASTVIFRLWLSKNGVDIADSMVMGHMHSNQDTSPLGRVAMVSLGAGDYFEVKWAVDDTHGSLKAQPSTAYSPASASAHVLLTRVHG